MKVRSLWHVNKDYSEIRTESVVSDFSDKRKINTLYSMISTGTESKVSKGHVSDLMMSSMSVPYMMGKFSLPIKYGYACSGVDSDNNICHYMHPHQDICLVNPDDLFITHLEPHKIPLISNMETVLNAMWDAEVKSSDEVAIFGYGNIGCLLAQSLKIKYNVNAVIIDNDPWKKSQAADQGFIIDDDCHGHYDIIFNTTSSSSGLNMALSMLKTEGALIELSWYGDKDVTLNLGTYFHYNRLRIISSQVSQVSKNVRNEISFQDRKVMASKLLESETYDHLITDIIDFNKAGIFFNDLRKGKQNKGLIYLFKY